MSKEDYYMSNEHGAALYLFAGAGDLRFVITPSGDGRIELSQPRKYIQFKLNNSQITMMTKYLNEEYEKVYQEESE